MISSPLESLQIKSIAISANISSAGAVVEGRNLITCTKTATGEYTITFNRQPSTLGGAIGFRRLPQVYPVPVGANLARQAVVKSKTVTGCVIGIADNSGTAIDNEFDVLIIGTDSGDQN